MLLRILKKDLTKRKGVNLILFLFITLATVFLASSVNNILAVVSAVDYYMDYAKVPDVSFYTSDDSEREQISQWLENEPNVEQFASEPVIMLSNKQILTLEEDIQEELKSTGQNIYVSSQTVDYNKVFDEHGNAFTLAFGEIAASINFLENNDLKVGDTLRIHVNNVSQDFTIKIKMKDAAFGSDMVGMSRLIVSTQAFDTFAAAADMIDAYYVMIGDEGKFSRLISELSFTTVLNIIERGTYKMAYSFDMIMAALLILIGICLILISMLVLRFTLVFTMEEAYPEIGIMKAVGFRHFAIKKIYLFKYLIIVSVGALLGVLLSLPISNIMVQSVSVNMIMKNADANIGSNILSAVAVVVIVLAFCYFCTRKLNKVTAIMAIRGGQSGERFSKRRGIRLYERKKLPVTVFLAVNDMISHVKRYLVLIITFCISFVLITIPLNTLNTMKSSEMTLKFVLNPDSAVYMRNVEDPDQVTFKSTKDFTQGLERIEGELKDKGYEASVAGIPILFPRFTRNENSEYLKIMTIQILGDQTAFAQYSDGDAPKLANEIAFSKDIMEENHWKIGDSVLGVINGKEQKLIITGTYSDYMQLGISARLNPLIDCSQEAMFDYWSVMVNMDTEKSQEEMKQELSSVFPEYEWLTAQEMVDKNVGGIQEPLGQMLVPMTAMLCAVIMLITVLMEKLFIVREKGEIAMLKSMGFKNRHIRSWQVIRMILVVFVSMIGAIPLSLLGNQFMLKPIFALMGADVKIQVVPWQVYGVYPGILLIAIIVAAIFATGSVKRINIREMNNLE